MLYPPQYEDDRYTYNEVRTDKTTLIVVTCNQCGKVVSLSDGSLEKWEDGHACKIDTAD